MTVSRTIPPRWTLFQKCQCHAESGFETRTLISEQGSQAHLQSDPRGWRDMPCISDAEVTNLQTIFPPLLRLDNVEPELPEETRVELGVRSMHQKHLPRVDRLDGSA